MSISGSVGVGGRNQYGDVKTVQQLLQRNGYPQLRADGRMGPKTIEAIKQFQSRFMSRPDGVVDIHGKTWSSLMRGNVSGNAPPRPAAPPVNNPSTGPLVVSAGQVTFDAEGDDSPTSRYFSRHIHWPEKMESGVTLGRGYDLGSRSEASISAQLQAAGVPVSQATMIAKGAGLKGDQARQFVRNNQTAIGTISHQQQINLFEAIYPGYVERARKNYDNYTNNQSGKVAWENLHPAIRDIMVDFVYQGWTKGPRPMMAGMTNDFDTLIHYIENTPAIREGETGRRRANYLRKNR
ncbi:MULTISPECIES: peptidoglycan-binding protein [unclassified Pantoea]|uniref:peptidoglycan-binding protein n=1 Tax=unclassified Pantoea TaxID=2630326 RepID=UPI0015D0660C|nr:MULTISPECIES: peptidoglycan-binding protein [unclassified Pantoea]NYS29454.1 peptidoglycan-binding protein [Pantoea sp. WMus005]